MPAPPSSAARRRRFRPVAALLGAGLALTGLVALASPAAAAPSIQRPVPSVPAPDQTAMVRWLCPAGGLTGTSFTMSGIAYAPTEKSFTSEYRMFAVHVSSPVTTEMTVTCTTLGVTTESTSTFHVGVPVTATASATPATARFDEPVTFTATFEAPAGSWDGSSTNVAFKRGSTSYVAGGCNVVQPVGTGSTRTATCTSRPGSFDVGTHTVTVVLRNSGIHAELDSLLADTDVTVDVVVEEAPTTVTLDGPDTWSAGDAVELVADVTTEGGTVPRGTVTLAVDGVERAPVPLSATGSARLDVSGLAPGEHDLTATYSGDANHTASTTAAPWRVAVRHVTAVTMDGPVEWTYGDAATVTTRLAGVSGAAAPTGTVTYLVDDAVLGGARDTRGDLDLDLSFLEPGRHDVVAQYSGDDVHLPASARTTVVVAPGAAAVRLAGPAGWAYGSPALFAATVTGADGAAEPTGWVTVEVDGVPYGDGAGVAPGTPSADLGALAPGTYTVTARYDGDARYAPRVSPPVAVEVTRARTAIDVAPAVTPAGTLAAVPVRITTGPAPAPEAADVTAWIGDDELGSGRLTGGTGTVRLNRVLEPGEHTLELRYAGGARYEQARATVTLTVAGIPPRGAEPGPGVEVEPDAPASAPGPARLPLTGAEPSLVLTWSALLVLAGAAASVGARRRRGAGHRLS